jgi:DNA-binding NtrC family response regulator
VIEIPPLRNRTDDIPLLARYFVEHYAKIMNKPALSIHPDAMNLLQQHHYPGNIRELRNIIERAVIMCEGYVIMPEHVTFKGKENIKTADHPSENGGVAMNHPDMDLPILTSHNFDLEDNTKAIIIAALEASGNSKRKACELLNITWQALNRRMTKYGM